MMLFMCVNLLQRATDAEILANAVAEGRIVLTTDLDFGYLLAVGGGTCRAWFYSV